MASEEGVIRLGKQELEKLQTDFSSCNRKACCFPGGEAWRVTQEQQVDRKQAGSGESAVPPHTLQVP